MILVDANLLVYAKMSGAPEHRASLTWLNEVLTGSVKVGFPWESLVAFVRITTNPRIFQRPLSVDQAWEQIEIWLSSAVAWIPTPTEEHRVRLSKFIPLCAGSPGLIHDAHLATLALSYGLTLASADSDFSRFTGLNWTNPIAR